VTSDSVNDITARHLDHLDSLGRRHAYQLNSRVGCKIHPNIIHQLRLGLPIGLLPSGFPTKTQYTTLSTPIRATCPAHLILLDFITRTILGEEYKSFSSSLCNLLHSPVTSSLLGPNIARLLLLFFLASSISYIIFVEERPCTCVGYQRSHRELRCSNTGYQ